MAQIDGGFDAGALNLELTRAAEVLRAFAQGPARDAADNVSASFERAGERIGRALGQAAVSGEVSFKRMAKVILEELAKIALSRLFNASPAGSGGLGSSVGGFGGSASLAGGASLGAAAGVNVHFHLGAGADAASITRHQSQIAAQVARAALLGRRNL